MPQARPPVKGNIGVMQRVYWVPRILETAFAPPLSRCLLDFFFKNIELSRKSRDLRAVERVAGKA
jgi:hypothetical protein